MLVLKARGRLCALPLTHAHATMRPLPVKPFSGGPAFVQGLAIIGGHPVPVVDLGALLGEGGPFNPTRFVTVKVGDGRLVALAVEGVDGVTDLDTADVAQLPPLLSTVSEQLAQTVSIVDQGFFTVLDATRLMSDELLKAMLLEVQA